jgi:hypothetical protein
MTDISPHFLYIIAISQIIPLSKYNNKMGIYLLFRDDKWDNYVRIGHTKIQETSWTKYFNSLESAIDWLMEA